MRQPTPPRSWQWETACRAAAGPSGTSNVCSFFLLIMGGQISAIGFLVAAKSILRFGTVSNDRQATEYVIIGTLASFAWAIAATLATQALLAALPGLEIGA